MEKTKEKAKGKGKVTTATDKIGTRVFFASNLFLNNCSVFLVFQA